MSSTPTNNVISLHEHRQRIQPVTPAAADELLLEFVAIMGSPGGAKARSIEFAAWSMRVMARYGALPSQKDAAKRARVTDVRKR